MLVYSIRTFRENSHMPGFNNRYRRNFRKRGNRGIFRRKPAARLRRKLRRRPTAVQALSLKNARAIRKLSAIATQKSTWQLAHLSSNVYQPYQLTQIIYPAAWQAVFNSDKRTNATDLPARAANVAFKGSSIVIRAVVQIESQTTFSPISCCYIVFRPRKNIARQFETNTVNGTQMQEGVHFTRVDMGLVNGKALWQFNTDILDILYIKNFMVSEYVGEGTTGLATSDSKSVPYVGNVSDATNNIYAKIPYTKMIKTDNSFNAAGVDREKSWTMLRDTDIASEDKVYCCLFNNAPGIIVDPPEDQKLFWTQNVMFHGRTLAAQVG
ncbi:MAG: putative capsid protein [Cressdnaviricota sp.]|nr:MAG: putative capsid protein [Cressdnaviricota sp.]